MLHPRAERPARPCSPEAHTAGAGAHPELRGSGLSRASPPRTRRRTRVLMFARRPAQSRASTPPPIVLAAAGDHQLQGSQLNLVPHYDVLEPEELTEDAGGGSHPGNLGPGAPRHILQEAGGPARAQHYAGDVTLGSEEAPGQSGASLSTGPCLDSSSLARARPVSSGSSEEEGPGSPRTVGSPDPVEIAMRSSEQVASVGLGPAGSPRQEGLVETVLAMEPGAMRFIQLYHEDLLAGLGDVALFPLEGSDTTGFRVSSP